MSEWFWIRDTLVVPGHETVAKATEVGPLLALYGSLSLCRSAVSLPGGQRRRAGGQCARWWRCQWKWNKSSSTQPRMAPPTSPGSVTRPPQWTCTPESPSHWSSVRFPDVSGAVAYIYGVPVLKGNAADNSANTHCGPSVKTCQTHLKVKQA